MFKVIFNYKQYLYGIQCNLTDSVKDIIDKFLTKSKAKKENVGFLHSGKILDKQNEQLALEKLINTEEKEIGQIKILVIEIDNKNEDYENQRDMVKSKNIIICPKCGEKAKIDFKNYKISLTCKNNDITNDILFKEFEKTQYKDESKIICGDCKTKTKSEALNNIFYRCISCNLNLCPLCESKHDKEHIIINYEQIEFICNTHNQTYTSFCNKCKIDLCEKCEKEHQDHDKIAFGKMIIEKEKLKERMKSLKDEITKLDIKIIEMINKLNEINN